MPKPKPPTQPVSYLLQVFDPGGTPVVKSFYENGKIVTGKLSVNAGDRIAWLVQALLPLQRATPPFEVTFTDPSFFGVPSISAPGGGMSDFLTVRLPQGLVKYSITAPSVGLVLDPDIQSGDGSAGSLRPGEPGDAGQPVVNFTVTWDTASNVMTWSSGGGQNNFPLTLNPRDSVTFTAVAEGLTSNFTVLFQSADPLNPTASASPFDFNSPSLPLPGTTMADAFPVIDAHDSGNAFTFVANIIVDGEQLPPSPTSRINMA